MISSVNRDGFCDIWRLAFGVFKDGETSKITKVGIGLMEWLDCFRLHLLLNTLSRSDI